MSKQPFLERLRQVENPTPSEEKILRFLESHYPLVAFETIQSISKKCDVGTATVARFVTRLGYERFSDFMGSLRDEVSSRLDTPIERFSSLQEELPRQSHEYLDVHAECASRNLERTLARIRPEDFDLAVELLCNTEGTLYVAGSATSHGLAYFFYMLATYMRPRVVLLEPDSASLSHALIDVCANDTLLAILHYRFSTATVETAKWFADREASIVLISDREHTPVTRLAAAQLFSCSDGSVMFNSRISTLMILEALLGAIAPIRQKDVHQRFDVFERLRERFGVFATPSHSGASRGLYESDGRNREGTRAEGEK